MGGQHGQHDAHHHDAGHHDAWHHHEPTEGEPQHEHASNIRAGIILQWMGGLLIALIATIVVTTMYFNHTKVRVWQRKVEITTFSKDYNAYRASMEAAVAPAGYEVLDPEKGTARAPINVIMNRVVGDYAAKRGTTEQKSTEQK